MRPEMTVLQSRAEDEQVLRGIVQTLAEAWTAGDGAAFGAPFAEDADYTVINGHYIKGRPAIAGGHQQIFDTVYRGTVMKLETQQVRFLRDDVATVHAAGGITNQGREEWPTARLLMVCTKENGRWQIAVFQNTPIASAQQ